MYEMEYKADLELDKLKSFKNHPFNALGEVSVNEMAESIKNIGVITPISVRPIDGEDGIYEILSGHKRVQAAAVAGLTTIPARILKNLSDEMAMFIVCDTNFFQTSFPSFNHSEKAKSISYYYNALKSQGKRNDLTKEIDDLLAIHKNTSINETDNTSAQVMQKSTARDKAVRKFGMDRGTITNYLRISKLSSELLKRLDNGEFKIAPAVEVSYLRNGEQEYLNTILENNEYRLDTHIAKEVRSASQKKSLSHKAIEKIFKESKNKSGTNFIPIKTKGTKLEKYFTLGQSKEEIESEIIAALELYRSQNVPEETIKEDSYIEEFTFQPKIKS